MEKRLPVREPYSVPDGELDGLDDVDRARLQRANEGRIPVPDNELTPDELAYVKAWRKKHGITETA